MTRASSRDPVRTSPVSLAPPARILGGSARWRRLPTRLRSPSTRAPPSPTRSGRAALRGHVAPAARPGPTVWCLAARRRQQRGCVVRHHRACRRLKPASLCDPSDPTGTRGASSPPSPYTLRTCLLTVRRCTGSSAPNGRPRAAIRTRFQKACAPRIAESPRPCRCRGVLGFMGLRTTGSLESPQARWSCWGTPTNHSEGGEGGLRTLSHGSDPVRTVASQPARAPSGLLSPCPPARPPGPDRAIAPQQPCGTLAGLWRLARGFGSGRPIPRLNCHAAAAAAGPPGARRIESSVRAVW